MSYNPLDIYVHFYKYILLVLVDLDPKTDTSIYIVSR